MQVNRGDDSELNELFLFIQHTKWIAISRCFDWQDQNYKYLNRFLSESRIFNVNLK